MQHKYTLKYSNDEVAITEVESKKDLGIKFDSDFDSEVPGTYCNRGYQRISKEHLPTWTMTFSCLMQPVLEYGNTNSNFFIGLHCWKKFNQLHFTKYK